MRWITLLCCAGLLLGCGGSTKGVTLAPGETFKLPDDLFPVMSWETPKRSKDFFDAEGRGLDSLAACGYTVAGFVRPDHLKQCEKLNLKAIVGPEETPVPWQKMTDEQIEK